jgi:hypothetical protein
VLAMARMPLPLPVVVSIAAEMSPDLGMSDAASQISELAESDVIRRTGNGDMLLHPVLRSLYRSRLRQESAEFVRTRHRALAEYYYALALAQTEGSPA